jgi:hypothetical protein
MSRQVTLLLAALAALPPVAAQDRAARNEAITARKLRADLTFLAGDGFRGRLTDTPENALSLEWVRSRFEAFGLKPIGPGGSSSECRAIGVDTASPGRARSRPR